MFYICVKCGYLHENQNSLFWLESDNINRAECVECGNRTFKIQY